MKAAVPCVTMIVLVATALEKPHRMTVLGVLILTGTALAAYGDRLPVDRGHHDVFVGVLRAFRIAVLQYLLGNLRFDLIGGLCVMAPASFAFWFWGSCCLISDVPGRAGSRRSPDSRTNTSRHVLGFCVNLLTLAVIKSTSSLTFKVVGQVKNTVVILVSVVVFGSEITFLQVVGYSISMVGFAVYQRGKQVQAEAGEEMDGYGGSSYTNRKGRRDPGSSRRRGSKSPLPLN